MRCRVRRGEVDHVGFDPICMTCHIAQQIDTRDIPAYGFDTEYLLYLANKSPSTEVAKVIRDYCERTRAETQTTDPPTAG